MREILINLFFTKVSEKGQVHISNKAEGKLWVVYEYDLTRGTAEQTMELCRPISDYVNNLAKQP